MIERLTEVAYFGAASFSSGQRKNALGYFAATYTEIYACISAGLQVLGATVTVCGRMSSTATLGTAAIAVWFAVVTLGFGVHLWPLLEGVR